MKLKYDFINDSFQEKILDSKVFTKKDIDIEAERKNIENEWQQEYRLIYSSYKLEKGESENEIRG